ncbi:MAG: radical SAM protein [Bacteroidales bacterium]|jgi:wyosine [tRNA(Phe)-imidazoG37] synthetase (radical SAM superfamily)|nr:radical SAM protein [Bacteroidales bacterium]MCK9500003.1 radical SAM protein [Bacteroidales bacterium]MDY0315917.1 radical SAM protein [Bacteroidales bacterium]NLB86489.1 radical SAM protein [Bacteroidales bacterium]
MTTFLFDKIIFGPVKSRRLGVSLGVNLLPDDSKFCNYNCIYCECGWSDFSEKKILPKASEVKLALDNFLKKAKQENNPPDVITFAGNGEPTIHPEFVQIIDDTIELRDKYFPKIKIAVLTNATKLHKPEISTALQKIEMPILKIDTMIQEDYEFINQPKGNPQIRDIADAIIKNFEKPIIQTMFIKANTPERKFDNTTDESLKKYYEVLKEINPSLVMVYSISRATPMQGIEKCSLDCLNKIAGEINELGFETLVTP